MRTLVDLEMGEQVEIDQILPGSQETLSRRLKELGWLEGSRIELVRQAPFGGDPLAFRCRGTVIALRRYEAQQVRVRSVGLAKVSS